MPAMECVQTILCSPNCASVFLHPALQSHAAARILDSVMAEPAAYWIVFMDAKILYEIRMQV